MLGWLQTCVKDVLQDRPSDSAIKIKALVENLKTRQDVIDTETLNHFAAELRNLATAHVNNLLITTFGMFVAPSVDQVLKKNISLLSVYIWSNADDQVKYRIGFKIDGYRTNLQQDRAQEGVEFLKLVDGRMYESLSAKIISLDSLADRLEDVHVAYDNYWHEPPIMREILQFCRTSADIPREVLPKLAKVVMRCRIGRGFAYHEGVSPGGRPLYDSFLGMMNDEGIASCISACFMPEINSRLQSQICQRHFTSALAIVRPLAISERLKEVLDFLIADTGLAHTAYRDKRFRDLAAFIPWRQLGWSSS